MAKGAVRFACLIILPQQALPKWLTDFGGCRKDEAGTDKGTDSDGTYVKLTKQDHDILHVQDCQKRCQDMSRCTGIEYSHGNDNSIDYCELWKVDILGHSDDKQFACMKFEPDANISEALEMVMMSMELTGVNAKLPHASPVLVSEIKQNIANLTAGISEDDIVVVIDENGSISVNLTIPAGTDTLEIAGRMDDLDTKLLTKLAHHNDFLAMEGEALGLANFIKEIRSAAFRIEEFNDTNATNNTSGSIDVSGTQTWSVFQLPFTALIGLMILPTVSA